MEVDIAAEGRVPAAADEAGRVSVAEQIARALRRHGVEFVIGQSIPSAVTLAATRIGIRQILCRIEKNGAIMGDGYARITRKVAVVTSCGGPGTLLLAAGLGEALTASVPVVALIQDVPRAHRDRNAAQELDDLAALRPVTKAAWRVDRADRVLDYIDRAFIVAGGGRPGPVALLLAPEMMSEPAVEPSFSRRQVYGTFPLDRVVADATRIAAAADEIAAARHPIVIAGGGVHLSDATAELAALVEVAALPTGTTTMGKGALDESHPLALGPLTYAIGNRSSGKHLRPMLEESDVVVLVGTRTNQNGTDSWKLYPRNARFIHIDIDGAEIGRTFEALRLVGDAKLTLAALTGALADRDLGRRRAARDRLIARIAEGRRRHAEEIAPAVRSPKSPIRPERVMQALDRELTAGIVVGDASYATTWVTNYLRTGRDRPRIVTPRGLAGIGWGFAMAIGAKLGAPRERVVYVGGDGAFGYSWSELETVVRHGLKGFTAVVLNNNVLGYQKDAEDVAIGSHTAALHFSAVDHAAIARACGWNATRVERPDDVEPAIRSALAASAPTFVEVMTDPGAYPPIITFDGRLPDAV
ncbi:MAG: acetolactate synthase catalytic subunit [Burkholderiales bacterium]